MLVTIENTYDGSFYVMGLDEYVSFINQMSPDRYWSFRAYRFELNKNLVECEEIDLTDYNNQMDKINKSQGIY